MLRALAERQCPRRETVSDVVDSHILKVGPLPNPVPIVVEIGKMPVAFEPGNDPGVALDARELLQHPRRRWRQRHMRAPVFESGSRSSPPSRSTYSHLSVTIFVASAPRQHQQTERRSRVHRQRLVRFHFTQHIAETPNSSSVRNRSRFFSRYRAPTLRGLTLRRFRNSSAHRCKRPHP